MFGLGAIKWAAYGLAAGLLVGYVKGCTDEAERGAEFRATVEAMGKAAEERAAATRATREAITKAKDKSYAKRLAVVTADRDRLRRGAARSILPPAPADSRRPDLACFDRGELDLALRAYREGVGDLVTEGAAFAVSIESAREWWDEVKRATP